MPEMSRSETDAMIREARRERGEVAQRMIHDAFEAVARLFRRTAPSRGL